MDLISNQGPLSQIWLAANYDRKLTKQQLLNTNLIKSTKYIEDHPIESTENSSITLRLSGQLLLGIVKIYSRKTKYLLEDVNDILYKLKNSFKLAMKTNSDQAVNLLPQQTTINLNQVILKDQITSLDLLHQEDLNLDDEQVPTSNLGGIFSQVSQNNDITFDQSMEFPRYEEEENYIIDNDFELDFDLDVEQGRRDDSMIDEREQSVIDIRQKESTIFDIDFGEPLDVIEPEQEPEQPQPQPQPQPQKRKRNRNEIVTNYRRLIVDTEIDLSVQELRDNQERLINNNEPMITISLSDEEKLQLLMELSSSKRRKLFNINDELTSRCLEIAQEEEQPEPEFESFDQDFDQSMDFDLPGMEQEEQEQQEEEELVEESEEVDKNQATIQVAENLTNIFKSKQETNMIGLIEQDKQQINPLGSKHNMINKKSQASKCFFELLVLATNDCITLDNDIIKPRDKLYNFI
ncbi:unnamed protein product [Candida verbasci]|uniref:Rad21/Rec8-like protein N-terminal domain-containing protein n=1 Tax=Candida verbasci TaxID=1227364 RepID=A0A9W4TRE3_9ASCO|nr:unnamed protein product [Candida verbasci]